MTVATTALPPTSSDLPAATPLIQARALSFYRQDEPVFGALDFQLRAGARTLSVDSDLHTNSLQPTPALPSGSTSPPTPLLLEYRVRLLTGLKQYFKTKLDNGSLSPASYQVLSHCCDRARHHASNPLALWDLAKSEVSSGMWVQAETTVYFKLKTWMKVMKRCTPSFWPLWLPARLLSLPVNALSRHLNHVAVSGLETATELWISLTTSLQTQWLRYSGQYGAILLEEVTSQAEAVWGFIIERRIEAPEKFQAIQTHRAAIALLSQQVKFVGEMGEGGMIEEKECCAMKEIIQQRLQLLGRQGPIWRQPTLNEIMANVPFLRGVHPRVRAWLRSHANMRFHAKGECVWEESEVYGAKPTGMFIVVRGVVKLMVQTEGKLMPYYMGSGGVAGLISLVLQASMPGVTMRAAYAEGNALGKGPVVMHISPQVLEVVLRYSREERVPAYQQLDLQIHRTAAGHVLDVLRGQVTEQLGRYLRSMMAALLLNDTYADSKASKRLRLRTLVRAHSTAAGLGGDADTAAVLGLVDWVGELTDLGPSLGAALLVREARTADSDANADSDSGTEAGAREGRRGERREASGGGGRARRVSVPKDPRTHPGFRSSSGGGAGVQGGQQPG
ncbi:MAG: hypothetical protein WDW36_005584 [Sanguina aurantia]